MTYSDIFQLSDGRWRCRIITEHLLDVFPGEGNVQLEELIAEINDDGYHVSNLLQTRDNKWQANLRTASGYLQQTYGVGHTPYLALLEALTKMRSPKEDKRIVGSGAALSGANLLAQLGLKKRTA
jgi:hypothetical protein